MSKKPQRKRRSKEEARAEILEVAKAALLARGPDGIRLDEIAGEIGVSRQALLHHFGSREGLLREVVREAWTGLFEELNALIKPRDVDDDGRFDAGSFIERVDDVTRKKGNARLGAWLLLSEQGLPDPVFNDAIAALPRALSAGRSDDDARQIQFSLLLAGAALFGDAIFGGRLRQALALPDTEDERAAFRAWLADQMWSARAH